MSAIEPHRVNAVILRVRVSVNGLCEDIGIMLRFCVKVCWIDLVRMFYFSDYSIVIIIVLINLPTYRSLSIVLHGLPTNFVKLSFFSGSFSSDR